MTNKPCQFCGTPTADRPLKPGCVLLCDSCKAELREAHRKGKPQPPDIDVLGAVLKEAADEIGYADVLLEVPTQYPKMFREMAQRHGMRCTQVSPTHYRFTVKK